MKNLENIFMIIATVGALLSMIACIYTGQSWTWQLSTILWIFVAYMKQKTITRQENLIKKITSK
jgi:hypothetical protein